MKGAFVLSLLTTLLGCSRAWTDFLDDDIDSWNLDRRSSCIGQAGKCFASGQCCKGFVCAAFDDLIGKNPEIPGYCVREKHLVRCHYQTDCGLSGKCVPIGSKKKHFCVDLQSIQPQNDVVDAGETDNDIGRKGLGEDCATSSECAEFTKRGEEMCCLDVKRYRQKPKRMCDRKTRLTPCIKP